MDTRSQLSWMDTYIFAAYSGKIEAVPSWL